MHTIKFSIFNKINYETQSLLHELNTHWSICIRLHIKILGSSLYLLKIFWKKWISKLRVKNSRLITAISAKISAKHNGRQIHRKHFTSKKKCCLRMTFCINFSSECNFRIQRKTLERKKIIPVTAQCNTRVTYFLLKIVIGFYLIRSLLLKTVFNIFKYINVTKNIYTTEILRKYITNNL